MTNEELLAAYRAGNASAFTDLWRINAGLRSHAVLTFARGRPDQDEAEAAIAWAFWRGAEMFDVTAGSSFTTYFMRSAHNAMVAETVYYARPIRDKSRVTSLDDVRTSGGFRLKDVVPDEAGNPRDIVSAREEAAIESRELKRRLRRLPERERQVYELLKQGLNGREIGDALGGVCRERGLQLVRRMMKWLRMTDEEFRIEKRRRRSLGGGTPNGRKRKRELAY